eukprot:jgi/Bigna1/73502/fgenesh1_pg.24_\
MRLLLRIQTIQKNFARWVTAKSMLIGATAVSCVAAGMATSVHTMVAAEPRTPDPLLLRELAKFQGKEKKMAEKWRKDDEDWRKLPSRAWPPNQPDASELELLEQTWNSKCNNGKKRFLEKSREMNTFEAKDVSESCKNLTFDIATTLVFNTLDPQKGLGMYQELAEGEMRASLKNQSSAGVNAMVATGIVLVEGLGVNEDALTGVKYIKEAAKRQSAQALFELGTLYYTGNEAASIDEDEKRAFELFCEATEKGHVGATYMKGDCLLDGIGVDRDAGAAVPLIYDAAKRVYIMHYTTCMCVLPGGKGLERGEERDSSPLHEWYTDIAKYALPKYYKSTRSRYYTPVVISVADEHVDIEE